MLTDVLLLLYLLLVAASAAYAWTFVVRYRRHQNWRKYPTGRHLMRFTFLLALVLTFTLVFAVLPKLIPVWLAAGIACVLMAGLMLELRNRVRIEGRAHRAYLDLEAAKSDLHPPAS